MHLTTLGALRRLASPVLRSLTVTGDVTVQGTLTAGSIGSGGDIVLGNGESIKTDTTTGHTATFQAYDVNGTAYKDFATLTNGDTPSFAIAAPSGGTVTIDGATIGGTTAAAGTFTTIAGTSASVSGLVTSRNATATPAAASAVSGLAMGTAAVGIYWGTGSPNTALTAAKGSLYIRTDGSTTNDRLYINTDASTAWTNITAAA